MAEHFYDEKHNDFYYDGREFGKGVHYTCLDYVPVSGFTPLSGTNWWRVDSISGTPSLYKNKVDLHVRCVRCGDENQTQTKCLRIEAISYDRNLFRVRFNPYAESFAEYNNNENNYGPITRSQLNWIQERNTFSPDISYNGTRIKLVLKDIVIRYDKTCVMTVTCKHTGRVLHKDSWVTPPGMNENNCPKGIVFVDKQFGSAVAAIKYLARDKTGNLPNFYGCGECQNYYNTYDRKQNHSSSISHSNQVVTFFNYDTYRLQREELHPLLKETRLLESILCKLGISLKIFEHIIHLLRLFKNSLMPTSDGDDHEYSIIEQRIESEYAFIPQYVTAPFFIEYPNDCSYAYGLLLDNVSQSYINLGHNKYTGATDSVYTKNRKNVYYFGAQYPELDYYLIFPSEAQSGLIASIIDNYTLLTGKEHKTESELHLRGVMPPKYIFGTFQGVYGFTGLERGDWKVKTVVDGYRESGIPLEGLALDIDLQHDFQIFTINGDFREGGEVGTGESIFEWAHKHDLVCQTNITNFIRDDQDDFTVYRTLIDRDLSIKSSKFIENSESDTPRPYQGRMPYSSQASITTVFPDFSKPETSEWWGRNFWDRDQVPNPLLKEGLDFVWHDMITPDMNPAYLGDKPEKIPPPGDPLLKSGVFNWKSFHGQQLYGDPRRPGTCLPFIAIRNLHAYMSCKATYEKGLTVAGYYPSYYNRSYIISRGGYIGQAHFGGIWTGDDDSSWKCMQIQVPKVLNMGICGFPIVGSDIGGFAPSAMDWNKHVQDHLIVRWVQASVLLPWFRDHYRNKKHEGKEFQELYNFYWPYSLTGRKYSDIMNDFVKMRVRFHHVLYSSMYVFCKTGLPPVKPTCLYEGGSQDASVMRGFNLCADSQYFVGEHCIIMVSPAMEDENCGALTDTNADKYPETIVGHPIWFPANAKWFPYDARYDGPCDPGHNFVYTEGSFGFYLGDGNKHRFTVPLENLPVFIREGAIIPTRITEGGSAKNIQQLDKDDEPFVFDIWPGKETTYQCYFDDGGKTRNAELNGEFTLLTLQQKTTYNSWQVNFKSDHMKYKLPSFIYIRFRAAVLGSVTDSMTRSYSGLPTITDLFANEGPAWCYEVDKKEEWLKVPTDSIDGLTITKKNTYQIFKHTYEV